MKAKSGMLQDQAVAYLYVPVAPFASVLSAHSAQAYLAF